MGRDYERVRKQLAHNMRELRRQQELSQEQLALITEIDRTYVSQLEREARNPSLLVLCRIASTLGVDVVDLLLPTGPSQKR